jgi:hypothetical protein
LLVVLVTDRLLGLPAGGGATIGPTVVAAMAVLEAGLALPAASIARTWKK